MKEQQSKEAIYNAKELGIPKVLLLGFQHLFAMFGATILVPIITGLNISTTLLFAGIGTIIFHLLTKLKVPAFLGSSFAFLGGYASVKSFCPNNTNWIPYAGLGVVFSALLYVILAILIKKIGINKIMRFFPPIVTGPIIIVIGLNLSSSAISSCKENWLLAIVAILIVIISSIFGKGIIKIIPIFLGVIISYIVGICTGAVDLSSIKDAALFGFPINFNDTIFSLYNNFDKSIFLTTIITIIPIALVTTVEHIGDMCAISSTVRKNFIVNPGLHRTLLGDGIATCIAALFGAPANTTYGENTGVLALTKVYDPLVIRIAAFFSIFLSFSPKFGAIIKSIPNGTIGGVSLILYGMISAIGIRNMVENKVDFTKQRNILIAAIVLVVAIGINYSNDGAIIFTINSLQIKLTGLSIGAIIGIVLNAIIPGKDYEFIESNVSNVKMSNNDE